MDRMPEAFKRFEEVVDTSQIASFNQLTLMFRSWAGERFRYTPKMMKALAIQSQRLGIPLPKPVYVGRPRKVIVHVPSVPSAVVIPEEKTWRWELVTVKGRVQDRIRDVKTGRFLSASTVMGVKK